MRASYLTVGGDVMLADDSAPDSFLICRSESRLCALRLADVLETMRPLPINPVPAMPEFLLGVAIIRGVVLPVVNVSKLIGGTNDIAPSRFVTVKLGQRQIAFAVESVLGIRSLNAQTMAEIPLLLQEIDATSVAAITTLDAELLLVLQSARVISAAMWEALDSQVPQI